MTNPIEFDSGAREDLTAGILALSSIDGTTKGLFLDFRLSTSRTYIRRRGPDCRMILRLTSP